MPAEDAAQITAEVGGLLETFGKSESYRELQRAEIIGRELPFAMPWPGDGHRAAGTGPPPSVMQGTLDLLYRLDGKIWIGDYKTDQVTAAAAPERAAAYARQAEVYRRAVCEALGLAAVGFRFIFLRSGVTVSV